MSETINNVIDDIIMDVNQLENGPKGPYDFIGIRQRLNEWYRSRLNLIYREGVRRATALLSEAEVYQEPSAEKR